jgi:hypothetical protein
MKVKMTYPLILFSILIVGIFILVRCNSSSRITYKPNNQQILIKKHQMEMGSKTVEVDQQLWIHCVGGGYLSTLKKEPFDLHYTFGEYFRDAKKLVSIQAKAYRKDKENQFNIELTKLKSDFEFTYTTPIQINKSTTLTDSLFKLIPEKIEGTNYPEMIIFDFKYTDHFEMKEYPDEIKVVFNIKWTDAEKSVDYVVKKTKYVPKKISIKY